MQAKSDIKKATGIDISTFIKKVNLIIQKLDVKELDIKKLKTVATCFINLKANK